LPGLRDYGSAAVYRVGHTLTPSHAAALLPWLSPDHPLLPDCPALPAPLQVAYQWLRVWRVVGEGEARSSPAAAAAAAAGGKKAA
jgi:hypothetical protein